MGGFLRVYGVYVTSDRQTFYIIPKLVLQRNHDNIQQLHTAVDIATLWYIAVYDL